MEVAPTRSRSPVAVSRYRCVSLCCARCTTTKYSSTAGCSGGRMSSMRRAAARASSTSPIWHALSSQLIEPPGWPAPREARRWASRASANRPSSKRIVPMLRHAIAPFRAEGRCSTTSRRLSIASPYLRSWIRLTERQIRESSRGRTRSDAAANRVADSGPMGIAAMSSSRAVASSGALRPRGSRRFSTSDSSVLWLRSRTRSPVRT